MFMASVLDFDTPTINKPKIKHHKIKYYVIIYYTIQANNYHSKIIQFLCTYINNVFNFQKIRIKFLTFLNITSNSKDVLFI